jgi:hypothetical protein
MAQGAQVETVGELIEALSRLSEGTRVLVDDGYEDGFDEAVIEVFQARRRDDAPWWEGTWVGDPGGEVVAVLRRVQRRG